MRQSEVIRARMCLVHVSVLLQTKVAPVHGSYASSPACPAQVAPIVTMGHCLAAKGPWS